MNKVLLKMVLVANNIYREREIGYSTSAYDEELVKIIKDLLDKVYQ